MAKKYYWLRLKSDFFKRHDIRYLESLPNGNEYLIIYLKLLTESIAHGGWLKFSDKKAYTPELLTVVVNADVETIKKALDVFEELELIERASDGTMFLNQTETLIGSCSSDEEALEANRQRVKRCRERKKQGETLQKHYSNVTCNGDIEIDKDIEIDNISCNALHTELSTLSTGRVSISDGSKFNKDYFDSIEV